MQALPQGTPAVLAAAAAGLGGAAVAQQPSAEEQARPGWPLGLFGSRAGKGGAAGPAAAPARAAAASGPGVVCTEYTRDRRRVYRHQPAAGSASDDAAAAAARQQQQQQQQQRGGKQRRRGADGSRSRSTAGGWEITDDAVRGQQRLGDLVSDYLLPQARPCLFGSGAVLALAWWGRRQRLRPGGPLPATVCCRGQALHCLQPDLPGVG